MDFQFDVNVFVAVVLGAVIVVQAWVIYRQSKGLEASLPPAVMTFIPILLQAARDTAAKTETTVDDKAVELLAGVIPMPTKSTPDELQAAG